MKYFAGIGSRKTPKDVQDWMSEIARILVRKHGYCVRTGDAKGADRAFRESGILPYQMEVYSPHDHVCQVAIEMGKKFHPAWNGLSNYAKLLIARNTYQLFGRDFKTRSKFVICWTPDGAETETCKITGGTGQAIRIAKAYDIPVINLKNVSGDAFERIGEYLE